MGKDGRYIRARPSLSRRASRMLRRSRESSQIPQAQLLGRRYTSPESHLAAALIEQAVADSRNIRAPTSIRRSARAWLRGAPSLVSFEQASALAGIDRNAVLQSLR